ncbi:sensor histidine kinase [Catenuloplanes indicus]|uniref:histidine kinase n=1 Tax=Catenuloplanes indicus TaxID=137267 RepID=A0AAE3W211_9ACTN|nr:PAS domain-containing sensor histidine kinase [Catenuloplanes indicus]MDQ0368258.1 PAS domain S-box-containing protein [Catenuloplanes indicus]
MDIPQYGRRLHGAFAIGAGVAVASLGMVTLLTWGDGSSDGDLFGPGTPAPLVAVALATAGCGLIALAPSRPQPQARLAGRFLGLVTVLAGAAGLIARLFGPGRIGPAALDFLGIHDAPLGRTSTTTALTLMLVGSALITLDRTPEPRTPRPAAPGAEPTIISGTVTTADPAADQRRGGGDRRAGGGDRRAGGDRRGGDRRGLSAETAGAADLLGLGAATIAVVALVVQIFGQAYREGTGAATVMSPITALAVLALCLGLLVARPQRGPLAALTGTSRGASVGRRLAFALVLLPVVAGLLAIAAVYAGVDHPGTAITGAAILATLALLVVLARLVRELNVSDRVQQQLVDALEERREFTETLLQSINEGVVVLDKDHRVLDVNRHWCELTGRTPREAIGHLPPYPWDPPLEVAERPGGDTVLRRPNGEDVPVLASMAALPGPGGPRAYVVTYVDITGRKRTEDAVAAHAAETETANAELVEANQRLERAVEFKSDLMSMVSHELAQPLSSIASLAELLTVDWNDLEDDIRLELSTKIDKNTRRLIGMMNDLTLLFRLDAGKVTARRTPVPVRDVAESAISNLPPTAPPVRVEVEPDLAALADRGHLWQILLNILSNAVKYGRPPIALTGRREGDQLIIEISDHGPGVPDHLVPTLFDRFMRGAGLGLFIVRHLAEANGGTVRYQPVEPHGALFVLTVEAA